MLELNDGAIERLTILPVQPFGHVQSVKDTSAVASQTAWAPSFVADEQRLAGNGIRQAAVRQTLNPLAMELRKRRNFIGFMSALRDAVTFTYLVPARSCEPRGVL